MYINLDTWNEMSEKQQEALQTAANKLEDERWKVAPEQTAEYEEKLKEYGCRLFRFLVHNCTAEI